MANLNDVKKLLDKANVSGALDMAEEVKDKKGKKAKKVKNIRDTFHYVRAQI